MKNIIWIFGIIILLISCGKKTDAMEKPANSAPEQTTKKIQLETFEFPAEVQGCSCYFAKDKASFENQQYIYVDDYGNNAFIKIDGKLEKFPMEEGDFDPENFEKILQNNHYKLIMKGKKIKNEEETMMFEGEISIEDKSNGEKTTSPVFGECGC